MAQSNSKESTKSRPAKSGAAIQSDSKSKGAIDNSITLDAQNPLPIEYNSNIFVSLKGKKYVPFLNPNDNFAQFLTELRLLSPTTNVCVQSKAKYCAGHGITYDGYKKNDPFALWAACVNRKQQSFNKILKLAFADLFSIGNAYVQVIRGKVGGKKFIKVYLRDYLDCRLSSPDEDDICTSVYVSKYFRKLGMWNVNMMKTEEVPIYSPNLIDNTWAVDDFGNQHTMFHLKVEASGYDYYGLPSNVGSMPEQNLEYKAARYNLDRFQNNLTLGGLIVVKGNMSDEEAKKIGKTIIHKHTGDGKQGRWLVISSESGIADGVQVEPFEKEEEGSFIESDTHNEEKIYVANEWNKLLIGGSEKKGIGQGNSAYIRSVFDIANNTVIMPAQADMMENFVMPFMRIYDDWMGTNFSDLDMKLDTLQPVSFLGDIDVNAITTVDEGRAIMSQPALGGEAGKKMIKTAPAPSSNDLNNSGDV